MRSVTIYLEDDACVLALASTFPEGDSLRPETRAAIMCAPENEHLRHVRDVACTAADAEDLATYFGSWADAFATRSRPVAVVCAEAQDAARHALQVAGRPAREAPSSGWNTTGVLHSRRAS